MRRSPSLVAAFALLAACGGDGDGPTPPPPPAVQCAGGDDTQPLATLAVGEVRTIAGNPLNCLRLAGGATSADYLAIVTAVDPSTDALQAFRLNVNADEGSTTALRASIAPTAVRQAVTAAPRMHDAHERLLTAARHLDLAAARAPSRASTPMGASIRRAIFPAGTPSVGQSASIRVPSVDRGDSPCTDFTTITGTVRAVSRRAIIVQDNTAPAGGFVDADFQRIAQEFDDVIFPADTAYFGLGSDIDANGRRAVILYTPEVNKATERGATSLLAGFFWAGDLFPREQCDQSNGAEIFYLLVPDPLGTINGNARATGDVAEKTRGTIAHEFEHMLNAGNRLLGNASAFEAVWLDEALAHFAEEVVGRRKLGVGDFDELTTAQIADQANGLRDYNAFFFQNLARFDDWLRNPAEKSATSRQADTSLAVRGAAWALLRHSADHFSNNDARGLMRRLAAGPDTGVSHFRRQVGQNFETIISSWLVANYADNLGIPDLATRYTYRSWDMRDAIAAINRGAYPLAVTVLNTNGGLRDEVRPGGGSYFSVPAGPATDPRGVQVLDDEGNVGFANGRLIVLRVR